LTVRILRADGTEFENAFLPPTGNICFGVWKDSGHGSVELHHIGLMFYALGHVSNMFTQDETNTVASYSGTFDFKLWPPNFDAVGVGCSRTIIPGLSRQLFLSYVDDLAGRMRDRTGRGINSDRVGSGWGPHAALTNVALTHAVLANVALARTVATAAANLPSQNEKHQTTAREH
jgi:hypothetical protein